MRTTKKLWSIALCICLGLTMYCTMSVAAEPFGEEILDSKQGAFDGLVSGKEGYIGNWQIKGDASIVPYDKSDTTETPDSYLKLVATSSTSASASYSSSYLEGKIAPKKTYLVSFEYASATAGQAYFQIYEYPAYETDKNDSHRINLPSTGGEWKESAFLFTTDASGAGVVNSCNINLYCHNYYVDNNGTDTVCFDNVMLYEVNTAETDVYVNLAKGTASAEGYMADSSGSAIVQLFPMGWTNTDTAVVSGYIKAPAGTSAVVSAGMDIAPDAAGKTIVGTGEWIPFQLSGIGYNKNITVSIKGAGAEVKDIGLTKDANLLSNASFEDTASIDWTESYDWGTVGEFGSEGYTTPIGYKKDGDCPDGSVYLYLGGKTKKGAYVYTDSPVNLTTAGERYLISVWYKNNNDLSGVRIQQRYAADKTAFDTPIVTLENTQGEWRKAEFITEKPSGTDRFYIQLGNFTSSAFGESDYAAFDAVSVLHLKGNEKISFYEKNGIVSENSNLTYGKYLGEPITGMDSATKTLSAVYLDSAVSSTATAAEKVLILAVYEKNENNVKQLTDVRIGASVAENTSVQYPEVSIDVVTLSEGAEIRAFVWDGFSGLAPVKKVISATK